MHLLNSLWTGITYICAVLKSPFSDEVQQQAIGLPLDHPRQFSDSVGPSFVAPSRAEDGNRAITCSYPKLRYHSPCSTPQDRSCWLKGPDMNYNIDTDYEKFYPEGITRKYYLEINEKTLSPDGASMKGGQVFNNTYPGPWLEGCWGDIFEVTVKNLLPQNGTTIHWHGLRQLGTTEMDGVNAITQCPIAPGESMTYRFRAMQYGTTWYHSHYSLQYGVGVAGPLTIHGPSTAAWDIPIDPLMMTDWSYRSAFEDWAYSLGQTTDPRTGITTSNPRPAMKSILLNGKGQYVPTFAEYQDPTFIVNEVPKHTILFQKGRKHLLRLINTAVDATFIFSIDNHIITVIGMDLVPIVPYRTDSVLVGIGQRYHVIVEAKPDTESPGGNYWIRTTVADGCSSFAATRAVPDERTGIVRYDPFSPYMPLSKRHTFPTACSDEDYVNLKPWLKWKVDESKIANVQTFAVGLTNGIDYAPYWPQRANISRWDMTDHPMWLNMSLPTLMNLDADYSKLPHLAVIETDVNHDSWVEMIITMEKKNAPPPGSSKIFVPAAHPIHLHGHDFALLEQSNKPYNASTAKPTRDNPPRRDVALLPRGGYIHIAFKADNPGAWLMHCHIAFHASSGLALQIIENGKHIKIPKENQEVMNYQCKKWRDWYDTNNHPDHPIQDDSAI